MNSLTPLLLALAARIARCVSLALLPALASESLTHARPQRAVSHGSGADWEGRPSSRPRSTPYLVAFEPKALRFQEPPPPIDIVPRTGPNATLEAEQAAAEAAAATEAATAAAQASEESTKVQEALRVAQAEKEASAKAATPATPAPLPILPDDTVRNVAPEDVLPFFQFPGNTAPSAPPPAPLPPSSATYQLK